MLNFLKSPFLYKGRIGRFSFFFTNGFWNGIWIIMIINWRKFNVYDSISSLNFWISTFVLLAVSVIAFLVLIENAVGRCNDIRCSKWWLLLLLIPLGPLILIFFPGEKGPNKYGEPPK